MIDEYTEKARELILKISTAVIANDAETAGEGFYALVKLAEAHGWGLGWEAAFNRIRE